MGMSFNWASGFTSRNAINCVRLPRSQWIMLDLGDQFDIYAVEIVFIKPANPRHFMSGRVCHALPSCASQATVLSSQGYAQEESRR